MELAELSKSIFEQLRERGITHPHKEGVEQEFDKKFSLCQHHIYQCSEFGTPRLHPGTLWTLR